MANHVSALKRVAQTQKHTAVNRQRKGVLRANLRSFRQKLSQGDTEKVRPAIPATLSSIDKAVHKGLLHKNTAARLKSRLMARVNGLAAK